MLKGEELSQAYASADIFVMPSESETLGFVVLEAMASGLAVVAVAAGGLTDIITQKGKKGSPVYTPLSLLLPRCSPLPLCSFSFLQLALMVSPDALCAQARWDIYTPQGTTWRRRAL